MNRLVVAIFLSMLTYHSLASALELSQADAGVYVVLDQNRQPTSLRYRFVNDAGSWRAEGRDGDGAWRSISCEGDCQYKTVEGALALTYLPPAMRQSYTIACVKNVAQAFCKYVDKENPSQGGYVVIALVANPPRPILVRRER